MELDRVGGSPALYSLRSPIEMEIAIDIQVDCEAGMESLPNELETIFINGGEPEAIATATLPVLGDVLSCDRCFLQVRHPQQRLYRIFCWRRCDQYPDLSTAGWQPESAWEQDDPMFAAALRTAPSIFINDIETADPAVLNADFERENFGHRALIHAHIAKDGELWGILQPCVFEHPRLWNERDRWIIEQVIEQLRPLVVQIGKTAAG